MTIYTEDTKQRLKPTGRRKISEKALILSELINKDQRKLTISKRDAIISFKNAAKVIGLSLLDIAIVETLCSCVPPKSFENGESIIAVVSNKKLLEKIRVPVDKRTVQRSISRLVNECIIIPAVGADQKRRTRGGVRHGFDLSPLRWRVEEFRAFHAQEKQVFEEKNSLLRTVGELRNACLAITDNLSDTFDSIQTIRGLETAAKAAQTNEAIMDAVIGLASLRERLSERLLRENGPSEVFQRMTKTAPLDDKNSIHQEETYKEKVSLETTEADDFVPCAAEKLSSRESEAETAYREKKAPSDETLRISPKNLVRAIPELDLFCPNPHHATWAEIDRAADYLSTHLGLNHRAWLKACEGVTRPNAVLILLGVMIKTKSGAIRNPAGLFVRLIQMAQNGSMTISSLFNGLNAEMNLDMRVIH